MAKNKMKGVELNDKAKKAQDYRSECIANALNLAWASLQSHLYYTYCDKEGEGDYGTNRKFHRDCVKEYAAMIWYISQLY